MNELLFVIEIVLTFGCVVAFGKLFGKNGLAAWIAVAMILANLTTPKAITLFGIDATLGTIMFASTFLATDIMTERYGGNEARKGVAIGIGGALVFMVCTQIALLYTPSASDFASASMADLFALNLRMSIASITMCLLANLADVWLFERIKKATNGKHLWLRNNVATAVCNCLENFAFVFLAFGGLMPVEVILEIAVSTSLIELGLAVCDTPFIYAARALMKGESAIGEPRELDTERAENSERAPRECA